MNVKPHKQGFKLSLTKDDFDWEYFTAGGHGGQKQNKTASAVRCTHRPSGSVGISRDERSQLQNKKLALSRCVGTEKFSFWAKMELARVEEANTGQMTVEQRVEHEMLPHNIRTEFQTAKGWVPEHQ